MSPLQLINKIKELLLNDKRVIALILVGSYARKTIYKATIYSDIEMYIVIPDNFFDEFKKDLETLPSKIGNVIFYYNNRWAGFSMVFENLQRLELPLVKKSEANIIFSRPIHQEVKVLFDKSKTLEKILKNRPTSINYKSFFKNQYQDFLYMTIYTAQAIAKGEYWLARQAMSVSLHPIIIRLLELHTNPQALNLEDRKRIEKILPMDDLKILKDISSNYDKDSIFKSFFKTLDIFSMVVDKIVQKQKFNYDKKKEEETFSKIKELLKNIETS